MYTKKIADIVFFDSIEIGHSVEFQICINANLFETFTNLTGDLNPIHTDDSFASSFGYKSRVVHGMLISSFLSTLVGMYLPGRFAILHQIKISFNNPVFR